jgi:hypothetical protein
MELARFDEAAAIRSEGLSFEVYTLFHLSQ